MTDDPSLEPASDPDASPGRAAIDADSVATTPERPAAPPGYTYLSPDLYASREPRPPSDPAPERSVGLPPTRRRAAWLVAVAAAVAAVGIVVAVSGVGRDDSGGADGASSPQAGAVGGVSAEPGVVATVSVQAADTVDVVETVTWPDGGPADIRLALPDLRALPGIPTAFEPRISDLEVTLDGTAAPAAADGTGWTVPYSAPAPSTMVVRYVVAGALVRSAPSESGRALLLVSPLSAPAVGSLPVRVQLPQDGVLGVGCPGADQPVDQLCGRQEPTGWTAELPTGSPAVVVVQLDLPTISSG